MNFLNQILPSELVTHIREYAINEPRLYRMWLARYKSIVSELDKGYRCVGMDSNGRYCVGCYSGNCTPEYCMAGNNCTYVIIDFADFQKSVSEILRTWSAYKYNRREYRFNIQTGRYYIDPITALHIQICASNGYQFYSGICRPGYMSNYDNLIQEFNQGPQSWRGYGNNFQKIWNLWFNSYYE